jgi:protease I
MENEKQVVMVLANYNYNGDEYEYTRRTLEDNGIGIRIAASELGVCTGVTGTTTDVDLSFTNVAPEDYSGIVFIGGSGVDMYFNNDEALELAKKFFSLNKVVAAICWAPVILARAGVLAQRKATAWDGAKSEIEQAGGNYTGEQVTVDNNIVTAEGPESATQFGQAIAELIGK